MLHSNVGQKIYYNNDLMYIIYEYDSTHIEKHKSLIKDCLLNICQKAHIFWYNKYEKELIKYENIKYILELQEAFFDTLNQLGIIF
jgi:hypothetical protein